MRGGQNIVHEIEENDINRRYLRQRPQPRRMRKRVDFLKILLKNTVFRQILPNYGKKARFSGIFDRFFPKNGIFDCGGLAGAKPRRHEPTKPPDGQFATVLDQFDYVMYITRYEVHAVFWIHQNAAGSVQHQNGVDRKNNF